MLAAAPALPFVPAVTIVLADFNAFDPTDRGYGSAPLARTVAMSLVRLTHRAPEAIAALQHALTLDPDWVEGHDALIITLDAQPGRADEARAARAAWWTQFGAARYQARRPHANDPDPDRPLRVGYVSGDFWMHSGVCCFGQLILGHSPDYQPVCFSSTPPGFVDSMTQVFQATTEWHDATAWTDDELTAQIRDAQIDILVDLTAHSTGNRLRVFCAQPAPVQVSGFGYATGVGWPAAMDGLFADVRVATPAWRASIAERVIDLPCVIGYNWPHYAPAVSALPCLTRAPTFGAFHQPRKLNTTVLSLWAQILTRVPASRIVFKGRGYTPDVAAWIRRQLPADRVDVVEGTDHQTHLAAYGGIDVQLDTFPQTGGVTTCEAALMGVPTVTLTGDAIIHRTSASIMTLLGIPEVITDTPEAYVDRAVALVTTERDTLALVRRTLRGSLQASPICVGYLDAVETAYRQLWRAWCAQRSATHADH